MALIQFLLGVDAPVSLLLLQQILIVGAGQHADRAAGLRAGAQDFPAGAARGSPPGAPAQLYDRRLQPAPATPVGAVRNRPGNDDSEPVRSPHAANDASAGAAGGDRRRGCALVMFAVIFFRLWYLQVLSGTKYTSGSGGVNSCGPVPVQAPRGEILDRSGNVMVGSSPRALVVEVSPAEPAGARDALTNVLSQPPQDMHLYNQLARVLVELPIEPQPCKIQLIGERQRPHVPIGGSATSVPGGPGRLACLLQRET